MSSLAWSRVARRRTLPDFSRLWGEGIAPLKRLWTLSLNHLEIRRLLDSGRDVTFVTSFFRSGNTWVRCLLTDVLLQQAGIDTSTADSRLREKIVPDIYDDLLSRRDPIVRDHAFVKTHENFDALIRSVGCSAGDSVDRARFIYLYRQPEDALVSFYHYRLFRQPAFAKKIDVNSFCLSEFPAWDRNVSSHLAAADQGAAICFLSYERLLQETVTSLTFLLGFLGIDAAPRIIERAVSNMEFQKLRSLEENSRQNAEEYFFRLGRQGSGIQELSEETLHTIRAGSAELLQRTHNLACQLRQPLTAPGHAEPVLPQIESPIAHGNSLSRSSQA